MTWTIDYDDADDCLSNCTRPLLGIDQEPWGTVTTKKCNFIRVKINLLVQYYEMPLLVTASVPLKATVVIHWQVRS